MKKLHNFFKPVPSHIVTDNFGQHIRFLFPIISPTLKPVVTAQDQYTNSTFYFSQRETEITVATSLSITFSLLPYLLEIISKQHLKHFKWCQVVVCYPCCWVFLFQLFVFFTINLFLMKNLDASIFDVLQYSVFLTLRSLFLSFSWEVHLAQIWPKSALLTPLTGATFVQLKSF